GDSSRSDALGDSSTAYSARSTSRSSPGLHRPSWTPSAVRAPSSPDPVDVGTDSSTVATDRTHCSRTPLAAANGCSTRTNDGASGCAEDADNVTGGGSTVIATSSMERFDTTSTYAFLHPVLQK